MTRISSIRSSRMFIMLAAMILLFVCAMGSTAHAQPNPPCDSVWIDTNIPPGVTVNFNWSLPGTTPASAFALPGSNIYGITPPGILNSFTVTLPLPCGATVGPFTGPWNSTSPGICIPHPCFPDRCLYIRCYMLGQPPFGCPYEIHVFENVCSPCKP